MPDPKVLELERTADKQRQQGEFTAAIDTITQALAIDEGFVRGHLSLAVLYHHTNEYELACKHAERACELEPGDTFNFAALSVTYQRAFEGTKDPIYIERAETAMARSRGM